MDLLELLLQDTHEQAGQGLAVALSSDSSSVEVVNINVFEVVLHREKSEARIFEVLDSNSEPTVVTLDELRRRVR